MSLNRKFFLFFLIATFCPLINLSYIWYEQTRDAALRTAINELEAIANLQKNRIEDVIDNYLTQTNLVSSRGNLQQAMVDLEKNGRLAASSSVQTSINAAKSSARGITKIALYYRDGSLVASTDKETEAVYPAEKLARALRSSSQLKELARDRYNRLRIKFISPISVERVIIGFAEITMKADTLVSISEDYTGLGKTGETVIAQKNPSGDAIFLTPLRFDQGAALRRGLSSAVRETPMTHAIQGVERVFDKPGFYDYRGQQIIAVTRFIPALDWGIVVKIDRDEVFFPIRRLQLALFLSLIFSGGIALILSFILSRHIALPIKRLTLAASKLQNGIFETDIPAESPDEIGQLGRTFKSMARQLRDTYRELEEKVVERTKELVISNETIQKNLEEAERINRLMLGRELKMRDLKKKLIELDEHGSLEHPEITKKKKKI